MSTILKQTAYIAMIITLLMQSGGVLFLYKIMQFKLKCEMANNILQQSNHFTIIQLTKSEYDKHHLDEAEIVHKGKLYDIKSTVIKGDFVQLSVLNDTEEELLLKDIEQMKENNRGADKTKLPNQLINLLTLPFFPATNSINFFPQENSRLSFQTYKDQTLARSATIFSPPPESA